MISRPPFALVDAQLVNVVPEPKLDHGRAHVPQLHPARHTRWAMALNEVRAKGLIPCEIDAHQEQALGSVAHELRVLTRKEPARGRLAAVGKRGRARRTRAGARPKSAGCHRKSQAPVDGNPQQVSEKST